MVKGTPSKAKLAPRQSVAVKRKKAENTNAPTRSKKPKIATSDDSPYQRTTKIKREPTALIVKQEQQECDICAETKAVYRNFPSLPTCSHPATVCSRCFERQFVTRINENREQGWSACACPLCGKVADKEDAQAILPRQVSRQMNTLITNVVTQKAHNWLWCPKPGCGQGQLHTPSADQKVSCKFCNTSICYKHQSKWHQGFTCDEFDQLVDDDTNVTKSVDEIKRITKACPHCKMRIKKDGGCNHMICTRCRTNWLWDTVPFDGEQLANSAEVKGGHTEIRPLEGAARQAVEQVMLFENARIHERHAAIPTGPRAPNHQARQNWLAPRPDDGIGLLQPLQWMRQFHPWVLPLTRNLPDGRLPGELVVRRDGGQGPIAEMFDHFARQVHGVRTTRNDQQVPHSAQPRPPAVVVLDESDVEVETGRQLPERPRPRRSRLTLPRIVIDLTGETSDEADVVDLTADD